MHFNLLDAGLLCLFGAAVTDGARRGFTPYATQLGALLLGLGPACLLAAPLGSVLTVAFGVPEALAGVGSFLIVLAVAHAAVGGALRWRLEAVAARTGLVPGGGGRLRGRAGAVPALAAAVAAAAVVLGAVSSLPGGTGYPALVFGSALGPPLARSAAVLRPMARLVLPGEAPVLAPGRPLDPGGEEFYTLRLPRGVETVLDVPAEGRMLELVNSTRRAHGVAPVTADPLLQAAAREHSLDMYRRAYFAHRTPDGRDPFDRMQAHGAAFVSAGENIAFGTSVDAAFRSLLDSPAHLANLLNPDFRCAGIGAYSAPGYEEMFTQDFTDCP